MNYRLYSSADFSSLYAIEEACFQPHLRFSRGYMRTITGNPDSATWIAEQEGRMVGFAIVDWTLLDGEISAYIQTIEVLSPARGKGVGSALLCHVEESACAAESAWIWLHVDAENSSAIRLYEARGYRRQGREENYYGEGTAAIIYAKPLGH